MISAFPHIHARLPPPIDAGLTLRPARVRAAIGLAHAHSRFIAGAARLTPGIDCFLMLHCHATLTPFTSWPAPLPRQ